MTTVYLAYGQSGEKTLIKHAQDEPVDILIAYPYLKQFLAKKDQFNINSWCLDSGAFSAYNSGKEIKLEDYIACCLEMKDEYSECFGLDVIYDAPGTVRQLEKMWSEGVDAIPCFHQGSSWKYLTWAKDNSPSGKIAISGKRAGRKDFIRQCFAHAWPCKIHGFAMASRTVLDMVPFHSVDAVTWCFSASATGHWSGYTGKQMYLGCRIKNADYWLEAMEFIKRTTWFRHRWRKELALLEELDKQREQSNA